ncbi:MAG: LysM peptidoglycan-binding domain-containing protein [Roseburia sp.]|nr:LysM peptidoglycan-binding domain-containing protein [Roseburia sp.]
MELPKNITQVGEWDRKCKIYVEDYVISYIKQMNHLARNKEMAVALYGTRKEEGDKSYVFLYGAGKLETLQKESRHLSQAQRQEIERLRKKYFGEYIFLGYCLLKGEMVEGFHICEQDICRYIEGYAQFYEKNDGMLAYMLEARNEEAAPEVVNQEKYEEVKRRQEERKRASETETESRQGRREAVLHQFQSFKEIPQADKQRFRGLQLTAVAVFGGLCIMGFALMGSGEGLNGLAGMVKEAMAGLNEQKLPDTVEVMGNNVQADTLIAEDKLTQALQKENLSAEPQEAAGDGQEPTGETRPDNGQETEPAVGPDNGQETTKQSAGESENGDIFETQTESEEKLQPQTEPVPVIEQTPEPVSYTIKKGDTLIAISIRNYGSDGRVQEICRMNDISNPDDIKVGQKILLP